MIYILNEEYILIIVIKYDINGNQGRHHKDQDGHIVFIVLGGRVIGGSEKEIIFIMKI